MVTLHRYANEPKVLKNRQVSTFGPTTREKWLETATLAKGAQVARQVSTFGAAGLAIGAHLGSKGAHGFRQVSTFGETRRIPGGQPFRRPKVLTVLGLEHLWSLGGLGAWVRGRESRIQRYQWKGIVT
jgi:hypothetical protein